MDFLRTIFFEPLYNALIFFYNLLGDLGLAIIAITVIVKVLLLPLANKALRSQRRLQALQPELKKLQEKHQDDREAMAKELMAFYKKEGVSPASSCLPTLVQIPVLITLFFVFRAPFTENHLSSLYGFVSRPDNPDSFFFGLIDLSRAFNPADLADPTMIGILLLALFTAVLQFFQSKMLLPADADGLPGAMNKQLIYLFPVLTFVFALTLPAALPLYWATTTLFTILQQLVIMRDLPPATAKAEAIADWNAANPGDRIAPKASRKGKGKKSTGGSVTVRKRGES